MKENEKKNLLDTVVGMGESLMSILKATERELKAAEEEMAISDTILLKSGVRAFQTPLNEETIEEIEIGMYIPQEGR